jgi:hypothetical protein
VIQTIRHRRLVTSATLIALVSSIIFAGSPAAASAAAGKARTYRVLVIGTFERTYWSGKTNPIICNGVPGGPTTVVEDEDLTFMATGKTKVTFKGTKRPTWLRARIGGAALKGSIAKYTHVRTQNGSYCQVKRPSPDGKPEWVPCETKRNQTLRESLPVRGSLGGGGGRLDDMYATTEQLAAYLDQELAQCGPATKRPDNTIYGLGRLKPPSPSDPGESSILPVRGGGWSNKSSWNTTTAGADWSLDIEWTVEIVITPA